MKVVTVLAASTALVLAACGPRPSEGGDQPLVANDEDLPEYAQRDGGEFPDCYETSPVAGLETPAIPRELFVIIDQTTPLAEGLIDSLTGKVSDYLEGGGARVTVASFSANTAGSFPDIAFEGLSGAPVPEDRRSSLNMRALRQLDECLADISGHLSHRANAEIRALVRTDSGDYANSEILGSLTALSEAVRASGAGKTSVLLVSDLLEHSSTTSFYDSRNIRKLDLEVELQKALDQRQFGDFGGAKVYVMGAGVMPPEAEQGATRNSTELRLLREFWELWFDGSNANLEGYGAPNLLVDLN